MVKSMNKSYIEICLEYNRLDDLIGVPRLINLFYSVGVDLITFIEKGYIEEPFVVEKYGDSCNRFTSLYSKHYVYSVFRELEQMDFLNFSREHGLDNGVYKIKNTEFLNNVSKRYYGLTEHEKIELIDLMDLKVNYYNKLKPSNELFDYCTHIIGKKRIAAELGITVHTLNKFIETDLIKLDYHNKSKFYLLDRNKVGMYKDLLNQTIENIDKEL